MVIFMTYTALISPLHHLHWGFLFFSGILWTLSCMDTHQDMTDTTAQLLLLMHTVMRRKAEKSTEKRKPLIESCLKCTPFHLNFNVQCFK